MGDRGDLLRALTLAGVALTLGCIDFVEPDDLPARGAPAITNLTVLILDDGSLSVTGRSLPGRDAEGFPRAVIDPDALAADMRVPPAEADADTLEYNATLPVDRTRQADPGAIRGPVIAGTAGTPMVRFPGLSRADPDTISVAGDGSLRLRLAGGADGARPDIRQWFLTLTGDSTMIRLIANGLVPETIDVPAIWVPTDAPFVQVQLIYRQSALIESVPDHTGLYLLDMRYHWTERTNHP